MITDEDIRVFTRGACFILAEVIAEQTGWDRYTFWDGFRPRTHVFVRTPDGRFLDVQGVQTRAQLLSRWGYRRVSALVRDWHLPEHWTGEDEEAYRKRAREIAPELIAQVKGEP